MGLEKEILIFRRTKVAIKMSRSSAKSKESGEGAKSESETSFSSDEEEEGIEDEDREETPDLYRNSALGMYTGVRKLHDSGSISE